MFNMTIIPPNSKDFWGKKDSISMARSLRLAVIQNQYDQNNITEEQAIELLQGSLKPDDLNTVYDDSDCLEIKEKEMIKCPDCNGTKGYKELLTPEWLEPAEYKWCDCRICKGTGKITQLQFAIYKARGKTEPIQFKGYA